MHKIVSTLSLILSFTLLTGCASVINGTSQKVTVSTGSTVGAHCSLVNNKGNWVIPSTPGSVDIHRSYNDLNVNCSKPGYHTATSNVESSTKPAVLGNLVVGGLIGAGVDAADGAAYGYPNTITVPMRRA